MISEGQSAAAPVQFSGISQLPIAALHSVPAAAKASAGHAEFIPVHVSAASHTSTAALHSVPAAA